MNVERFRDDEAREQDMPGDPHVSDIVLRIRKQYDALADRADRLANLLESVLYNFPASDQIESAGPPQTTAPKLVEDLRDILHDLNTLTRRLDSLGDRVAL